MESKECGEENESTVAKRPCTIKIAQLLEEENAYKTEQDQKRYIHGFGGRGSTHPPTYLFLVRVVSVSIL